ncbi:hypothetical protein CUMW_075930, partial [Citrus unshiu]
NDVGDVYIALYGEKKPPRVEVYSLATNSWRTIGNNLDTMQMINFISISQWSCPCFLPLRRRRILCQMLSCWFDFDSEKFGRVMLPIISNLRLIEGCLHFG